MAARYNVRELEKFWKKVDKSGDCWRWTACTKQGGYGVVWIGNAKKGGVKWLAHRFAKHLVCGELGSHTVNHHCDNRWCVRPSHLYLGSRAQNNDDWRARGKAVEPVGGWHQKGRMNAHRKVLDQDRVRALVCHHRRGATYKQLEKAYGCDRKTAWRIVHGKAYAYWTRDLLPLTLSTA